MLDCCWLRLPPEAWRVFFSRQSERFLELLSLVRSMVHSMVRSILKLHLLSLQTKYAHELVCSVQTAQIQAKANEGSLSQDGSRASHYEGGGVNSPNQHVGRCPAHMADSGVQLRVTYINT